MVNVVLSDISYESRDALRDKENQQRLKNRMKVLHSCYIQRNPPLPTEKSPTSERQYSKVLNTFECIKMYKVY